MYPSIIVFFPQLIQVANNFRSKSKKRIAISDIFYSLVQIMNKNDVKDEIKYIFESAT